MPNIANTTVYAMKNMQKVTLTTTDTGGASSSAVLYPDGKIVATITNASEKLATVTINTPLDFSVVDVTGIRTDSCASDDSGKVSVYNNSAQIISSRHTTRVMERLGRVSGTVQRPWVTTYWR